MSKFNEYLEMAKQTTPIDIINESIESIHDDSTKIDDELNALFKELVPPMGKAETQEGEMVRAIMRLLYRYFNDGDFYYKGYGKETAGPSATYLKTKTPISKQLTTILNAAKTQAPKMITTGRMRGEYENQYEDSDGYKNNLYKAASAIIKYVKSKDGKYTPNDGDSR